MYTVVSNATLESHATLPQSADSLWNLSTTTRIDFPTRNAILIRADMDTTPNVDPQYFLLASKQHKPILYAVTRSLSKDSLQEALNTFSSTPVYKDAVSTATKLTEEYLPKKTLKIVFAQALASLNTLKPLNNVIVTQIHTRLKWLSERVPDQGVVDELTECHKSLRETSTTTPIAMDAPQLNKEALKKVTEMQTLLTSMVTQLFTTMPPDASRDVVLKHIGTISDMNTFEVALDKIETWLMPVFTATLPHPSLENSDKDKLKAELAKNVTSTGFMMALSLYLKKGGHFESYDKVVVRPPEEGLMDLESYKVWVKALGDAFRSFVKKPVSEKKGGCGTAPTLITAVSPKKILQGPTLTQIVGHQFAKDSFRRAVITPATVRGSGLTPQNVLLYGPGGTGKSALIRAAVRNVYETIATYTPDISPTPLFMASAADIKGKYVGESAKCLQLLIENAREQRGIVFIDEIDSLLSGEKSDLRGQWKTLVQSNDGAWPIVVGATNEPHNIESAILRRFGFRIFMGLPTPAERRFYIGTLLPRKKCNVCHPTAPRLYEGVWSRTQWQTLLHATRGWSLADLDTLFDRANTNMALNPSKMVDPNIHFREETVTIQNISKSHYIPTLDDGLTIWAIPEKERANICWPQPQYVDMVDAQANLQRSVQVRDLKSMINVATMLSDTVAVVSLQNSLKEIDQTTDDTYDMTQMQLDINNMTAERKTMFKQHDMECQRLFITK